MKNPESLGGWTGLLNLAMVAITCLFAAMGFSGYLCFGDDTLGSITLNLPNDDCSCLALIFPVTIEMLTILAERGRPSMVVLAKDVLIVFVGLIACVTGTYTALRDIVNTF
nr:hypothetical protein BaRGS_005073 [Batillaria attramentaria]